VSSRNGDKDAAGRGCSTELAITGAGVVAVVVAAVVIAVGIGGGGGGGSVEGGLGGAPRAPMWSGLKKKKAECVGT